MRILGSFVPTSSILLLTISRACSCEDVLSFTKPCLEKITLKNFKAYFFGFRNGVIEKPDPGWNIIEEEGIDFLVELIKKEANIADAI